MTEANDEPDRHRMKLFNYNEAAFDRVIRPQKAEAGERFDEWITQESPVWQRERIVQLRRYLGHECGYGMSFDDSDDCWKDLQAYPFVEDFDDGSGGGEWVVGVACFSNSAGEGPILEFCWMHPFWRNRGLLKVQWPHFLRRFGAFGIEDPVTPAMAGFLKSVGHYRRLDQVRAAGGPVLS